MSILLLPNKKGKSKTKRGDKKMASFWNGLKTGFYDLVTFGGYSKEREREKQEELNNLQMQREDTAYQRTVEDMNKAGLNPLTMSGTNNAQPLTNPIKSENNTFDKAMQLGQTISTVAQGLAQAKNLNSSTTGMKMQNEKTKMDLDYLKRKGLSPAEYEHQKQKELADLNKGFWGRVGNDIYDKLNGKIDKLIDKGTEIVNQGIVSLAKGEFKDAVEDKAADFAAEKTGVVGRTVKNYGENRKSIYTSLAKQKMDYYQKEIDYWSKTPTPENLKKVNEMRKKYKEAEEELEKLYGKHWRNYL